MKKAYLVTMTMRVLGCPNADFICNQSVYDDRNKAIRIATMESPCSTYRRVGKNDWVEVPNRDTVHWVTEIHISPINRF